MRIWSIHPRYLDWMGLGAQWREGILAQVVVQGKTKGWKNHPQLNRFKEHPEPLKAAGYYLTEIHAESKSRGYNYNFNKIIYPTKIIQKIPINRGQLQYEFEILQERLRKRTPSKYVENKETVIVETHPLFTIREGPPELWEKSYWNNL